MDSIAMKLFPLALTTLTMVASMNAFAGGAVIPPPPSINEISPTNGEIHFSGELVNSACGIAASSSPVLVEFGQIPTSAFKDMNEAGFVQKNIELQYCDTTVAQSAEVVYTPNVVDPVDPTLAAVTSGSASGIGVGMRDGAGQAVAWGQSTAQVTLVNGTTNIPFGAFLKANSASGLVTPGEFSSVVNFQVNYQ